MATRCEQLKHKSIKFQQTMQFDNEPKVRTDIVSVKAIIQATGQIYTDQTGRFPISSSHGKKYIIILQYDYDSNAILAKPRKSKSEIKMVHAYTELYYDYLANRGPNPLLQELDNECPTGLQRFMSQNGVNYQLVPASHNSAKQAISSFKDHFHWPASFPNAI
jgi:hypothetical protein